MFSFDFHHNYMKSICTVRIFSKRVIRITEDLDFFFTHLWEVNRDRIMMPLSITHLRHLPAPLSGLEHVEVLTVRLLTQQEDQATVVHEQGIMVTVHS